MSTILESSIKSIVDFVAKNTGHDPSAFSAFAKEFGQELEKAKLDNLDGSENSKKIAAKVQAYILQNGGSSLPLDIETIVADDDKAINEEKNKTKSPDKGEPPAGNNTPGKSGQTSSGSGTATLSNG